MNVHDVLEILAAEAPGLIIASGGLLILYCLLYGLQCVWCKWQIRQAGIAYRDTPFSSTRATNPTIPVWEAERRAETLLHRLYGVDPENMQYGAKGFEVVGGATGHHYRIIPRVLFPVIDLTSRTGLCAQPFNSWSLPQADKMLTHALYLQCPETELAFVAIANKAFLPSTTLTY